MPKQKIKIKICRYQANDDMKESLSGLEELPRASHTTSIKKKRKVIFMGDSLLRGIGDPTCSLDPIHREYCCLPGARVRDITRKVSSLLQHVTGCHLLLVLHINGDEVATGQSRGTLRF